jgi:hypothetical protein
MTIRFCITCTNVVVRLYPTERRKCIECEDSTMGAGGWDSSPKSPVQLLTEDKRPSAAPTLSLTPEMCFKAQLEYDRKEAEHGLRR